MRNEMKENIKLDLLDKFPNLRKTIPFLLSSQNTDGSYVSFKSNPDVSMYFLGIINELNEKPKFKNTYRWVKSLQTGKRGFGETTGENSWDYTSYWGSQMHKSLGLKPNFEKDYINFINSHQNLDGGFGTTTDAQSNLDSTIHWSISLIDMNYKVKNQVALTNFLNTFLEKEYRKLSLWQLYYIVYILTKMNYEIKLKKEIISYLKKYYFSIPFSINLEKLYYILYISRMLGDEANIDKNLILKCQNRDGGFGLKPNSESEPASTYFAVRLLKMSGNLTNDIKNKTLPYVHRNELTRGGFTNEEERNNYILYCCIYALNLLGYKPKYVDKLKFWLKCCQNSDGGFGYSPNSYSMEKSTYWSIFSLKLLNSVDIINKEKLIEYLDKNIINVNPAISYYLLSTYELLDIILSNYKGIVEELLRFQNLDGGFGLVKCSNSQMYETFRVINSINSVCRTLNKNHMDCEKLLDLIKKRVIKWVFSCENENGGFSWIPNEISYIQPTYHALTVLDIFGEKVDDRKKHIKWILQFQSKDGGFNGGVKGTPSDAHFTFWALNSLKILNYFDY